MRKEIETIATSINKNYYVSTAYRKASVIVFNDILYYETLVWTLNKGQLDKIIYSTDSGSYFRMANKNHHRLVKIFTYLEQRKLRRD